MNYLYLLAIIFTFIGCGAESSLTTTDEDASFVAESSCFREYQIEATTVVTINAFSIPRGCEVLTTLFNAEADAILNYTVDGDKPKFQSVIHAAQSVVPDYSFYSVTIYGVDQHLERSFILNDIKSGAEVELCAYKTFSATTCESIADGKLEINIFQPERLIELSSSFLNITSYSDYAFQSAHDKLVRAVQILVLQGR